MRRVFAIVIVGSIVTSGWCETSSALPWIEQAQADLTCSGSATDTERNELARQGVPALGDKDAVTRYFRSEPRDLRAARLRYLTTLAAIAWWADQINDQSLRTELYSAIGAFADRYVAESGDALFRHIARCARSQALSAMIELDQPQVADRLAGALVGLLSTEPPSASVEDWPLILALREASLDRRTRAGIAQLATRAAAYAGELASTGRAERASRLLAALAQGALALGQPDNAQKLAAQSMAITGRPPNADAVWRAFAPLFDASVALSGEDDAARLTALLPSAPPGGPDKYTTFESLVRLAWIAEFGNKHHEATKHALAALAVLSDHSGRQGFSMPFFRHALKELVPRRDAHIPALARRDAAFAARTLASYTDDYTVLLKQAQTQFVANAREQLFFQSKMDSPLRVLSDLYTVMPRAGPQIADTTFRLAQLRSFGRLTLATLSAELGRTEIDPASRFSVERFFTLSTQAATWLRLVFARLRVRPESPLPSGESQRDAFFILDVFFTETSTHFDRYVAMVREKAPAVAALATPRPLPVQDFQRRLKKHEAIVATLVTPLDLYVWTITSTNVTLTRHRISERELQAKVQRLRAGLLPGKAGGATTLPPFDAQAAHELYRLILEPAASLAGVTEVIWYGHGALGSVPPAVLVSAPPVAPSLRTPAEFAETRFLVDRFAFSTLADLSLFAWDRDRPPPVERTRRFLGVGAPMLSPDELAGAQRARSYALAGGFDGKALADFPKLEDSVDEMKALARAFGESNSVVWLGPDANERRLSTESLIGYHTIALATHGFLPNEVRNVPEPALMLALENDAKGRLDGILTSSEIARLKLDADFVILSACNTASADGRPRGETFTGLTQAFFTAGARSLMVSHWPVISAAAVQLSVGTVTSKQGTHVSLGRSLQLAMQAARKEGASSEIESHPSYWGPFVIVGDGR